jgi:hypothetical protein
MLSAALRQVASTGSLPSQASQGSASQGAVHWGSASTNHLSALDAPEDAEDLDVELLFDEPASRWGAWGAPRGAPRRGSAGARARTQARPLGVRAAAGRRPGPHGEARAGRTPPARSWVPAAALRRPHRPAPPLLTHHPRPARPPSSRPCRSALSAPSPILVTATATQGDDDEEDEEEGAAAAAAGGGDAREQQRQRRGAGAPAGAWPAPALARAISGGASGGGGGGGALAMARSLPRPISGARLAALASGGGAGGGGDGGFDEGFVPPHLAASMVESQVGGGGRGAAGGDGGRGRARNEPRAAPRGAHAPDGARVKPRGRPRLPPHPTSTCTPEPFRPRPTPQMVYGESMSAAKGAAGLRLRHDTLRRTGYLEGNMHGAAAAGRPAE